MSEAVTRGVRIRVDSMFLEEESHRHPGVYFFAYHISISNEGEEAVKLLSRHWIITDGHGQSKEVKGPGVIGKQPTILPGKSHEYSSFCPLPTEVGSMQGTYRMKTAGGETFNAVIAPFTLAVPSAKN